MSKQDDIKEFEIILNNTQKKLNKTKNKLNHLRLRKNFFFWGVIFMYPLLLPLLSSLNLFVVITIAIVPLIPWVSLIQSLDNSADIYINEIKIIKAEIDKIENKILKKKYKDSVFKEKEIEKITKKIRWLNIILFVSALSELLCVALMIWGVILGNTNAFARLTLMILAFLFCYYELDSKFHIIYRKKRFQEYRKKIRELNSNNINAISHTLILRSFKDDAMLIKMIVGDYIDGDFINDTTFEELLNDIFKKYGSVQICAAPFLTIPYVGAERIYLGEGWRDVIKSKAKGSQLIVLIPPISIPKGLEWELSMLIEQNLLSKIVLIFPPDNIENLESRWLSFQDVVYKYSKIRFNGTVKYKRNPICCTFSEKQDNNINLKVKYSSILGMLSGRIKYEYESVLPSVIKKMISH